MALGVGASGLTAIVYLGTPFLAVAFVGVGLWGVATAVIAGPSRTLLQRSSPSPPTGGSWPPTSSPAARAELVGVAMAGLLVGAFGVPWSITALGLMVATTALLLYEANERDKRGERGRSRATTTT